MSVPRCYDLAQTFFIDASLVKYSPKVNISAVDLFFHSKPNDGTLGRLNKSGIMFPGVTVLFCETAMDGTPNISKVIETARLEYNDISVSGDATAKTTAVFENEVFVDTNKEWSIVIFADGHEDFGLWTNKKGDTIVGTSTVSSGTTNKFVRNLYTMLTRSGDNSGINAGQSAGSTGLNPSWVSLNDEDLKFRIYVCRFRDSGSPSSIAANPSAVVTTDNPQTFFANKHEFIMFDSKYNTPSIVPVKNEYMFQNTSFSIGTVSVSAGNSEIVGTGLDFTTLYGVGVNNDCYVVIVSESSANAYITDNTAGFTINVRKISSFNSPTSISVDRLPTITNTAAKILLPTAVGRLDLLSKSRSITFDNQANSWYYDNRVRQDYIVLRDSNSNNTVRFVNNSIDAIIINAGGSGYSNTDTIKISSSTNTSVNATATLTTNSTGGIVSVYISNNGCGMLAAPTFIVANTTNGNSSGTGANLSFIEGPTLRGEASKVKLKDIQVFDFSYDIVQPIVETVPNASASYKINFHSGHYKNSTTPLSQRTTAVKKETKNAVQLKWNELDIPVLLSRSNLMARANSSAYVLANGYSYNNQSSAMIEVVPTTNNDFVCAKAGNPSGIYYKYHINNDYTGENTPYGNAAAKHISEKITFAQDRFAEDLVVELDAYRPIGTDIKVFARLHSSKDPEAFDDKDWTLLEVTSGANNYSSVTDKNDIYQYTFGIPKYPNTAFNVPGLITTTLNSANISGTNTSFTSQATGVIAGDVVKIYSTLFPDNYMISVVNNVVNSSFLTITNPITNNNIVGSGFAIDKIQYPLQGFRNFLNSNVLRYYNTATQMFDGYNTFAIKIVLLSSSTSIVPEVEDIKAIGVSA